MYVTYGNGTFTIFGDFATEAPNAGTVFNSGIVADYQGKKLVGEGDSFIDVNAKKVYLNNGSTWVEW